MLVRRHDRSIEVGALIANTPTTPYWLQTNQYGIVPKASPAGLLIATLSSDYRYDQRRPRRLTDWGYGLQFVGQLTDASRASEPSRVLVAQAYAKFRLSIFEVWGGRRRQVVGLAQSPLSSGSYIWSANALPLPRIELAIPEFTPVPLTRGWLAIKGFYAHGWFGDTRYVRGSYLHQKVLYARLGKAESAVRLYGAFTHQAQWGGYAPFLAWDPRVSFNGHMPTGPEAYLWVVVPIKTQALKDLSKFTTYDQNRVGDHRGSAEAAIDVRLPHGTITHYQQHFYDLGRKLYNFRNIEDGLYGLRFTDNRPDRLITEALVELFNSGSHGIVQFGKPLGGEAENYFLNGQYPDSWSYRGRTLGTPFMSQAADVNPNLPSIPFVGYTKDIQRISGRYGINNNRVWAVHSGLSGALGRHWRYTTKATYSKNYGSFMLPFPPGTNQFSGLLSVTRTMQWPTPSTLITSVGYDRGKLLPNERQVGAYVAWRKTWTSAGRQR